MDPTVGTGELGVIENADILLDGDTIAEVGKNLQGNDAQVVDATGKIVMPCFVDMHNHLWQSFIRGCGTDKEVDILAGHDVRILHNPLSNMRLASGVIRLPELKQAGVHVGLGLDGGTNDTNDMFNTMRVAVGLQRAKSLQARIFPTVADVLRMVTVNGAELLDMFDRIGSQRLAKKPT
jgi:cytosine/adenosine deaminase-related metal-dependent hydrolase